jgi:hypothetical protein
LALAGYRSVSATNVQLLLGGPTALARTNTDNQQRHCAHKLDLGAWPLVPASVSASAPISFIREFRAL